MDLIRLFSIGESGFVPGEALHEASGIKESRVINDQSALEFDYPAGEKAALIDIGGLVLCEGRKYEIVRVTRKMDGRDIFHVVCEDMFSSYAKRVFLGRVPAYDYAGQPVSAVLDAGLSAAKSAFPGFRMLSPAELAALGMEYVGAGDESAPLIDFFSMDKTSFWDFVKAVIETAGRGELYTDGLAFAVVERTGADRGVRLSLDKNLTELEIERSCEDIVNKLWAFGADDMPMSGAYIDNGHKKLGVPYIKSEESIAKYGLREGFRDYSDSSEPQNIYAHALWEFDERNPDRIDIPRLTISGRLIDLSKLSEYGDAESIELGDTVRVYDTDGTEYTERVIEKVSYPLEAEETTVTLGHIKRDLFYSLYELTAAKRYVNEISTTTRRVRTRSLRGVINSDRNSVKSENELFEIYGDLLTIYKPYTDLSKARLRLGNYGGEFVLNIYDQDGQLKIKHGEEDGKFALTFYQEGTDGEAVPKIRIGDTITGKDGRVLYGLIIFDRKKRPVVYMDNDGEVYFGGTLKTSRNAEIGASLSVGSDASAKIMFQGPAVTEGYIEVVDKTMTIQANESIDIRADSVTVNGRAVVSSAELTRLKSAVEANENSIAALRKDIAELQKNGG